MPVRAVLNIAGSSQFYVVYIVSCSCYNFYISGLIVRQNFYTLLFLAEEQRARAIFLYGDILSVLCISLLYSKNFCLQPKFILLGVGNIC
jgi:hypothetical protein